MKVESIAECSNEHSAILSTFIKLPVVIKIFVLSIFEWPFYTGYTVHVHCELHRLKLLTTLVISYILGADWSLKKLDLSTSVPQGSCHQRVVHYTVIQAEAGQQLN